MKTNSSWRMAHLVDAANEVVGGSFAFFRGGSAIADQPPS